MHKIENKKFFFNNGNGYFVVERGDIIKITYNTNQWFTPIGYKLIDPAHDIFDKEVTLQYVSFKHLGDNVYNKNDFNFHLMLSTNLKDKVKPFPYILNAESILIMYVRKIEKIGIADWRKVGE